MGAGGVLTVCGGLLVSEGWGAEHCWVLEQQGPAGPVTTCCAACPCCGEWRGGGGVCGVVVSGDSLHGVPGVCWVVCGGGCVV